MSGDDATARAGGLPLARASAERCGLGELRHLARTGSTNDDLADEARSGVVEPAILVADHQIAGRGRRDRRWEDAGGGALLFSLRLTTNQMSAHDVATCLAAAALAAADSACPVVVAGKWPNDLVVENGPAPGKLGGMLSELVLGDPDVVVVGAGINLEPVPGQSQATSISECGGRADRDRLLADIIDGFAARRSDAGGALTELRARSATLGRVVHVDLGTSSIVGRAVDITDEGRLLVNTDEGDRIVSAGDVVHLRPSEGPGTC